MFVIVFKYVVMFWIPNISNDKTKQTKCIASGGRTKCVSFVDVSGVTLTHTDNLLNSIHTQTQQMLILHSLTPVFLKRKKLPVDIFTIKADLSNYLSLYIFRKKVCVKLILCTHIAYLSQNKFLLFDYENVGFLSFSNDCRAF